IVADLEFLFRATWHHAGGAPYPPFPRAADESATTPGSELALVIALDDRGRRSAIRRHIIHALHRARELVWINNAYFVPDRALRGAFRAAAGRGIDVRIIVPGASDVRSVQWAGEYTYAGLLKGGVRLY